MPTIAEETSECTSPAPEDCVEGANSDVECPTDRPQSIQGIPEARHNIPLLGVQRTERPVSVSPFADVYRAVYAPLGVVAVKEFRCAGDDGSERQTHLPQNLLLEIGALKHDNLLPILGLCEGAHGDACVVTAWHDSLATYLTNRNVSDRRRLLLDVVNGLNYLHSQGYHHGKLHPWNVLVTESGRALLTDYCIADYIPDDGSNSMRASHGREKALFVAPEVYTDGRRSQAADVFSFGMLMCYVVCGGPPPAGSTALDIVVALGRGWRPSKESLPQHIDEAWYSLMDECWEQVSSRRPDMHTVLGRLKEIDVESGP